MSEADPALIGRKIDGKYVIEKFLGGGAMGAVYKAKEPSLDRHVAIKVMHGAVAVDPQFVARFHREAKAASRFDHPSSIRIVSFGEESDGLLYIVMEYVEGRDLYRVIHEDYPIPVEKIADVMAQALSALAVAHEKGLIHRDLKPENLMIVDTRDDDDPSKARYLVKVCDFGIAKMTEKDPEPSAAAGPGPGGTSGQKLTTQGLVVGTPEYMSPEQARGEKLDARSDIYSMGIILYQLLIGRTPFTAESALGVVLKHITETPQPPHEIWDGVHRGLEAVCLKAMEKRADDRYQSAREMRAAIKAAMDGRPMPVDQGTAATMELVPNGPTIAGTVGGGTGGMPGLASGTAPGLAPPQTGPVAVAPTVAGMPAPSDGKMPPAATDAGVVAAPKTKGRTSPLLVAVVALAALLAGGGALYAFVVKPRMNRKTDVAMRPDPSASAVASATSSTPATPTETALVTSPPEATVSGKPLATGKTPHAPTAKSTRNDPAAPGTVEPPATQPNGTVASNDPPPPTAPVVTPPPPPTAAPPAPAPAFNPGSCRASLGPARSVSASNVKNFREGGLSTAVNQCAKTAIKDRPAGPLSTTVRISFSDNKAWKGGVCNGCPGPLAACVSNATRTTSVTFKDGDAVDAMFEVPLTFNCD